MLINGINLFFKKKRVKRVFVKKSVFRNDYFYLNYKEAARRMVSKKVLFFNNFYNYKINKISIRNQKTRWASCSSSGNLNFNYKMIFLPENLIDYIVVHEICHLGEFNHSKKFWLLVEKKIPEYRDLKDRLKKIKINF